MCAHVYVRAWGLGTRDIHMTKVRDLALALGSLGLAPFSLRLEREKKAFSVSKSSQADVEA